MSISMQKVFAFLDTKGIKCRKLDETSFVVTYDSENARIPSGIIPVTVNIVENDIQENTVDITAGVCKISSESNAPALVMLLNEYNGGNRGIKFYLNKEGRLFCSIRTSVNEESCAERICELAERIVRAAEYVIDSLAEVR